ncbi:MAG: zinc ribbon domain-containing protein [Nitrospiria bacterium]
MRIFLIPILIGLITAIIANSKGQNFLRWWIKGTLYAPFSLIYALFMKRTVSQTPGSKAALTKCPHCSAMLPVDATTCGHCKGEIDIIDV